MKHLLIEHAAPTLAGLKTANMFNYCIEDEIVLNEQLRQLNQELNPKGVYLEVLRHSVKSVLVYVYRPKQLRQDLKEIKTYHLLKTMGYDHPLEIEKILTEIKQRLQLGEEFPHEIGILLGYPIDDVIGFITQGGENYKYCGYWKVYKDEEKSLQLFEAFNHCRQLYDTLFLKGYSLEELTVL